MEIFAINDKNLEIPFEMNLINEQIKSESDGTSSRYKYPLTVTASSKNGNLFPSLQLSCSDPS